MFICLWDLTKFPSLITIIKSPLMINTVKCVICDHQTYLLCCSQTQQKLSGICQECLLSTRLTGNQSCHLCHQSLSSQILRMRHHRKRHGRQKTINMNRNTIRSLQVPPNNSQFQKPIEPNNPILQKNNLNMTNRQCSNNFQLRLTNELIHISERQGQNKFTEKQENSWPVFKSSQEQVRDQEHSQPGISRQDIELLNQVMNTPFDFSHYVALDKERSGIDSNQLTGYEEDGSLQQFSETSTLKFFEA